MFYSFIIFMVKLITFLDKYYSCRDNCIFFSSKHSIWVSSNFLTRNIFLFVIVILNNVNSYIYIHLISQVDLRIKSYSLLSLKFMEEHNIRDLKA